MLKVQGLDVNYGYIQALKGVSLNVSKGEMVTLVGANGAGKSTLLKTICGLLAPRGGSITLNGIEISGWPTERIVRMGLALVPEGRQVFGPLSVKDNLILGAYTILGKLSKAELKSDLARIFEIFPVLQERRRQLAGTLSGGEQQMLAIGRALMSRPKILLLDEPALGLAPLVVKEIFRVIKELRDQGISVLLVEQNARAALKVADRGYIMEVGSVVLEDTSARLLANEQVKRAYLGR